MNKRPCYLFEYSHKRYDENLIKHFISIIILVCSITLLTSTVHAKSLPFGFEFGQSKDTYANKVSIDAKNNHYCDMEDMPQFSYSYIPKTAEDYKLYDKVNGQFKQAKILEDLDYSFQKLRNKLDRDDFIAYATNAGMIKSIRPPISPHTGMPVTYPENQSYHKTKEYKQKKYVLEGLYSSDEFKRFLNYRPNENIKEQIVYKIDSNWVCAQYINNQLTQISLNKEGFTRDLYKIIYTILDKYEGQNKTYLVSSSAVSEFCGYKTERKDCPVGLFEANFDEKTKIKVVSYDRTYKKSFFGKPLEEINNRNPYINYRDETTFQKQHKIETRINENYSKSIMKPIYIILHKLMFESEKIEFTNDLLDQF